MKSLLDKVNAKLNAQGGFFKAVSVLVGGTAFAQAISLLALPFLTRLYGPASFSVLAVYVAILSLIAVIACLRFEIAIPIPKSNLMAAALCVLALLSTVFFCILTTFIIAFIPEKINELTENKVEQFLWLIPAGVLIIGVYNSLQYWTTRRKNYSLIAETRVLQSLMGTSIKVGGGYFFGGAIISLILGQLVAQGSGFIKLVKEIIKNDKEIFKRLKFIYLKLAFIRYQHFPKYSTSEGFANIAGTQIPIILIAYYTVGAEAGYLMVALQLLSAPMSLIGSAIAQVYLAEAPMRYHRQELKVFTKKTIINLMKIASLPLLIAAIFSPLVIPYILGDQWYRTGVMISWMAPWFFVQFITSPVSMSLHITGNQKIALLLQLSGLLLRVSSVIIAAEFINGYVVEFYALSSLIFYTIYFFVVFTVISNKEKLI